MMRVRFSSYSYYPRTGLKIQNLVDLQTDELAHACLTKFLQSFGHIN